MMRHFLLAASLLLVACGAGGAGTSPPTSPGPPPVDCAERGVAYPPRPFFGGVGWVPEPGFLSAGGVSVLPEYHCPGGAARLLVVRAHAAWCGPCQWSVGHTAALLSSDLAPRLSMLDALIFDEENQPADPAALARWQARYDVPVRTIAPEIPPSAMEPGPYWLLHYGVAVDGGLRLPLVVLLDRRTMKAEAVLGNPSAEELLIETRRILARLDGQPEPRPAPPELVDGRFTRDEWGQIEAMALPQDLAPPPDPSNRYSERADAVNLGRLLFNDERLGSAGVIGCVTCHPRATARQDGRPQALGLTPAGAPARGDRNTPSLIGAGHNGWQFLDGRCDTLWCQALAPFENDREISGNRLRVVRLAIARYPGDYSTVLGTPPDLSGLPMDGGPGMPAWDALPAARREAVTRAYVGLGKSIAAFMRRIQPAPVALDRYARGQLDALTPVQKDGLKRFMRAGCIQCHHGWRLSDESWHQNYFATGRQDCEPDLGREAGAAAYARAEFRSDSAYSDGGGGRIVGGYKLTGKFRTPTLRGVADTAPYTHGGTVADLPALVRLYSEGGLPDGDPVMVGEPPPPPGCPNPRPARTRGDRDIGIVRFNAGQMSDPGADAALVAFLRTLKASAVDQD